MALNRHDNPFARRFWYNTTEELVAFCESVGIGYSTIRNTACGRLPRMVNQKRIADGLGISVEQLLSEINPDEG
ncbi:MAG: hypothetical protein ACKV2O_15440 [Acidimicrobiales bacterium]